jgi:hypothetical protein
MQSLPYAPGSVSRRSLISGARPLNHLPAPGASQVSADASHSSARTSQRLCSPSGALLATVSAGRLLTAMAHSAHAAAAASHHQDDDCREEREIRKIAPVHVSPPFLRSGHTVLVPSFFEVA